VKRLQKTEAVKRARIERVFEITTRRLLEGERYVRINEGGPAPGKPGEWGTGPGGSGYQEHDERMAHDVPERSFKADLKRKLRLKKIMRREKEQLRDEARRAFEAVAAFSRSYREVITDQLGDVTTRFGYHGDTVKDASEQADPDDRDSPASDFKSRDDYGTLRAAGRVR